MLTFLEARAALARHLEAFYDGTAPAARVAGALRSLAIEADVVGDYTLADAAAAIAEQLEAGGRPTVVVVALNRQWSADERAAVQQFTGSAEAVAVFTEAEARALPDRLTQLGRGRTP